MSNTRKVTVWSTKGKKKTVFETDVANWGDLKKVIGEEYDLDALKATENITKTSLEHSEAALPEGDFVLFLRPAKTKSGVDYNNMSFKELRSCLTDDDKAVLKIKQDGRNWTQSSTAELKAYLNKNSGSTAPTAKATEALKKTEAKIEKVKKDKKSKKAKKTEKAEVTDVVAEESNEDKAKQVKVLLNQILEDSNDEELIERLETALKEVDNVLKLVSVSFAAQIEAEAENERLETEADDIMSGF